MCLLLPSLVIRLRINLMQMANGFYGHSAAAAVEKDAFLYLHAKKLTYCSVKPHGSEGKILSI